MFDNFKRRVGTFLADRILDKNGQGYNPYNDAFLQQLGINITHYDPNNETYLEKGYNHNPVVYSVIKQMSLKASSIPRKIRKVKNEKFLQQYDLIKSSDNFQSLVKKANIETKAFQEEEMEMPLERPNSLQTWEEFFALSAVFMKTTGNCFWYMLRPTEDSVNEPIAMYVLPAHETYLVLKPNASLIGVDSPIDNYKLLHGNQYVDFPAEDVIHIKNPNPNFDLRGAHLYGQSDLRAALRNVQSSNEAIENNIRTMKSGGAFGFLHSKGQNVLTAEQAGAIKDRLKEMDADKERLGKITGVSAEIGFTRIALTTDELKPFDHLNFDEKQICNVLGWSTKLLNNNDDSGGLNNGAMDQERKRVITDTIMPMLNHQFASALNTHFLPLFKSTKGCIIEWDPTELPEMQADIKMLSEWLNGALDRGVITRDEYRTVIKFSKIGSDEMMAHTVNMNVINLEDVFVSPLDNE